MKFLCLMLVSIVFWSAIPLKAETFFDETFEGSTSFQVAAGEQWGQNERAGKAVLERTGQRQWQYFSFADGVSLRNFSLETRFIIPAFGSGAMGSPHHFTSFWFRVGGADMRDGYFVSIRPHGIDLLIRKGSESEELASVSINMQPGTWYDLRVLAVGSRLQVFLNGLEIISVSDNTYREGRFGFSNANLRTSLARVRIASPETEEFAPLPGMRPPTIIIEGTAVPGRDGKKGKVFSELLDRRINFSVHHKATEAPDSTVPYGIIYLKNLPTERIGQESNVSILNDYLEQGFTILILDYENDPRAVSPNLEKEVHNFLNPREQHQAARRPDPSFFNGLSMEFRPSRVYILPEGFRVQNNIPYFDMLKHGPHGIEEMLLSHWNEKIVPANEGFKEARSFQEMHMRNGDPVDPVYIMDVIYPSQAKNPVPILVRFATDLVKDPNAGTKRFHFTGFNLRGGAYATVGHPYDPLYRNYWRELGSQNYTLVNYLGLASAQAALRQLAARADEFNIDPDLFFGHGHSKGQSFVTRMLNPHHESQTEMRRIHDQPRGSPEPQPFADYPAQFVAGYQSAGSGNFYYNRRDADGNPILVPDYLPTLIAVGENDQFPVVPPFHRFVARLKELGVTNFVALFMPGLGHEIPIEWNPDLERDNYEIYIEFFQKHGAP